MLNLIFARRGIYQQKNFSELAFGLLKISVQLCASSVELCVTVLDVLRLSEKLH